ncbi:MAG: DoxX family protein [Halioglobus sp.]|nr:DoxX family protein [Halioglobus sp.]
MSYHSTLVMLRTAAAVAVGIAIVLSLMTYMGDFRLGASDSAIADVNGSSAIFFLIFFLVLSGMVAILVPIAVPRLVFLLGLFPLLIGWRIASLSALPLIEAFCATAFVVFVLFFLVMVIHELRVPAVAGKPRASLTDVQLAFIRLYIGLDFVPHFTEKLFAGPATRAGDLQAFEALGVPDPLQFVLLAGVIEFAAACGVGLGVLTRLAAILTVCYLMVATMIGHHFSLGFIWASPGGGWEYPVLWSLVILSYVLGGGRWMSLDQVISERVAIPRGLEMLMGDTSPKRQ